MSALGESLAGPLSVSLFPAGAEPVAAPEAAPRDGRAHVVGDRSTPLRRLTIPQVLAETAARRGGHEAAVFSAEGRRLSWRELERETDRLAAGLLALGLSPGDRLGIWSPNRSEWLITQFATARIGVVLVTINPAYREAELEYALTTAGCAALIAAPSFRKSDYLAMLNRLAPELAGSAPGRLRAARLPALRLVVRLGRERTPGMFGFEEVCEAAGPAQHLRLEALTRDLDPDDAINIQFTSGTTGSPKGATLTHANIVNNAHFTMRAMGVGEADRLCIPVPLYHCFGMVLGTLGCVTAGATMVFPGESFEAGATLAAVAGERCTVLYGVPTMFIAMLDHPDFARHDLTSLRTGMMAGAPCPVEVMRRVVRDMHMPQVTIGYGMTETSPISFQTAIEDSLEDRVGTVGRVHPHVEAKIVDEGGRTLGIDEPGELCTRGYSVMRGYWGDEARTREAIDAGGWMRTGDLATLDARGYCRIVGRVKDMVIRGGENIYPREVEELLYTHPKVAEAQVFGVADDRYGEELCAFVVLQPGESASSEEIAEFCRGRIAHFKVPRHIRIRDALPMTVTGKPQKFLMRQEMEAELRGARPVGARWGPPGDQRGEQPGRARLARP